MKRWHIIAFVGASIGVISFFLFPLAIEWWFFRTTDQKFHRTFVEYPSNRINALAPVFLWDDKVPGEGAAWRENGSFTIHVRDSGVFHERTKIPLRSLRDYVDTKIAQDKQEYLIVIPARSTTWSDLWKTLDEARKSRIQIVFVKYQ